MLYTNLARVALVWMDEWQEFYFKFNPGKWSRPVRRSVVRAYPRITTTPVFKYRDVLLFVDRRSRKGSRRTADQNSVGAQRSFEVQRLQMVSGQRVAGTLYADR